MKIDELKKLLKKFETNIFYNADLKKKNWFNIGGKTKVFFKDNELTRSAPRLLTGCRHIWSTKHLLNITNTAPS